MPAKMKKAYRNPVKKMPVRVMSRRLERKLQVASMKRTKKLMRQARIAQRAKEQTDFTNSKSE